MPYSINNEDKFQSGGQAFNFLIFGTRKFSLAYLRQFQIRKTLPISIWISSMPCSHCNLRLCINFLCMTLVATNFKATSLTLTELELCTDLEIVVDPGNDVPRKCFDC